MKSSVEVSNSSQWIKKKSMMTLRAQSISTICSILKDCRKNVRYRMNGKKIR